MIFTRHSVLKRGCSTWDRDQAPQSEFQSRLDEVRREMSARGLDAAIVHGDNYSFADVCYLTNYFPKVRGGVALVPRQGPITLLLNIGSRDVPFAKTLTWVDDVRASNQLGRDTAELLKTANLGKGKVALVDSGRGLALPHFEEMKSALPDAQWSREDALLLSMRLKKSARELAAIKAAGGAISAIADGAREFIKPGRKEYEIIADIDRLARDHGVEDVRILAGEKRLQPPSFKYDHPLGSHWALYLAVQHERYWAEAARTYIFSGDTRLQKIFDKARESVQRTAAQIKPGTRIADVRAAMATQLGEFYPAASLYGIGNGIGLSQWEAPYLDDGESAQEAKWFDAATIDASTALALRVIFESAGKIIAFGDTFEVTAGGATAITDG